jgi:hypothetical protein
MALLLINGTSVPVPKRGLTEVISTNVNSGRNALGEMVGERVGRDIYKIDNIEWTWLTKDQWAQILQLVSDFKFHVTFPDARKTDGHDFCTHLMYCGDRSCEPYYINANGDFKFYRSCKMNLIDVGLIDD